MRVKLPDRPALPVDDLLPDIVGSLRRSPNLVLEAPPGAGKTTRVPPALLEFGQVLVLEPRRLAARLAARRVAFEMGERVGETAGYQVRFEEVAGPRTRLRYLTEGVFIRRLLADPELRGVAVVVLDEFHERHLEGDLALALLRALQQRRDLRLVVMSATLDGGGVAAFLGGCPRLRSEGRLFNLSIDYTPHSPLRLEEQVAGALDRLLRDGLDGDMLVFLPGAAEIRHAAQACRAPAARAGLLLLPLHGDLPPEEQDRAVQPAQRRKVILSTNVAESSVTIDGVTAAIDSGLARVARDSPWTGLPSLNISRISKASADQRAGRAGRTRPGRVVRLYPLEDYSARAARDTPEIERRELTSLCLQLKACGYRTVTELQWMSAPPEPAVRAAEDLLARLGAADASGALTPFGRRMAQFPLHPRLSAFVLEAERRGAGRDACTLAAVLSEGERRATAAPSHHGPSDLLALLDARLELPARRLRDQIRRLVRPSGREAATDESLLMAVLKAFPDRVARRRAGQELLLAGGGPAILAESSVVAKANLLVAVDVEERREKGLPLVRLASAIEPEWLLDLFPERIEDRTELEWNREAERVESASRLLYDGLVIAETRGGAADAAAAAQMLAGKALEAGFERFADADEVDAFVARVNFAAAHGPVPAIGDEQLRLALTGLCEGRRSFAELAAVCAGGGLLRALERTLAVEQVRLLERLAPARMRLPGGRWVRVHYAKDKPPWIASRLQDFFRMRETPRMAGGAVPVVVHLLAPNQRPVQMTTDLAGFWERLYPQVRRELCRRYPRHAWPERPE